MKILTQLKVHMLIAMLCVGTTGHALFGGDAAAMIPYLVSLVNAASDQIDSIKEVKGELEEEYEKNIKGLVDDETIKNLKKMRRDLRKGYAFIQKTHSQATDLVRESRALHRGGQEEINSLRPTKDALDWTAEDVVEIARNELLYNDRIFHETYGEYSLAEQDKIRLQEASAAVIEARLVSEQIASEQESVSKSLSDMRNDLTTKIYEAEGARELAQMQFEISSLQIDHLEQLNTSVNKQMLAFQNIERLLQTQLAMMENRAGQDDDNTNRSPKSRVGVETFDYDEIFSREREKE